MHKLSLSKGFTLIELLVVIAILGILAAVVLVAINPAARIAEANDSGKKSAIGQVATALEACYTANQGAYTNCVNGSFTTAALVTGDYLKNDISDVSVRASTVTGEAIAYTVLEATSNIAGSAACPSGQSAYLVYRSSTGETGDANGKAVCAAAAPTS